MQNGGVPAASLPMGDDSDSESDRHSAGAAGTQNRAPSPASSGSQRRLADLETRHAEAMARLDEYDALAHRVLGDATLDPGTAVHRLADHIAKMAERISALERQPQGAKTEGGAPKADDKSILASAERELQLMEELIKQQDAYIAQLETAHE